MPTYAEILADIDERIEDKVEDESIDNIDISTPMKAIVNKIQEVEGNISTGFVSLPSISALEAYTGAEQLVFVSDSKRGGLFHKGTGTANGGTIFNHPTSGQWLRWFDPRNGVDPCWFGAIGNAINDDINALDAAYSFAQANNLDIVFRPGVYRITRQWLLGFRYISESDALIYPAYSSLAPSYNSAAYSNARFAQPITTRASARTTIFFDATPSELTAAIYYGIIGGGNSASRRDHTRSTSFENIQIVPAGWYNNTTGAYTPQDTPPTETLTCGIATMFATSMNYENVLIRGFGLGLLSNHSYYSTFKRPFFSLCKKGMYGRSFNSNHIDTPIFDRCTEGADLTGQSNKISAMALQYCRVGLRFRGWGLTVDGCYAENDIVDNPNDYQFIIGRDPGDPDYDADGDAETQGVFIRGLNAATANRPIALLKADCGQVTFSGVGGGEIETTAAINIVAFDNFDHQTLNVTGPGVLVDLAQVNDTPLPEYASNAAARAAGLQTNDRYHTGGVVKIVLPA